MLHRLLTALLAAGITSALAVALLWAIDGSLTSAQEDQPQYERKNCPPGFHWVRLSGQCCVQDEGTLPGHGKINFDGTSVCEDGYTPEYERRPTTDGEGPPGCPNYTSFPFLTACHATDSGGAAVPASGTTGGGGVISGAGAPSNRVQEAIRDASESLYDGGGGPSKQDLALAGGLTGGFGVLSVLAGVLVGAAPLGPGARFAADASPKRLALEKQLREAEERLRRLKEQEDTAQRKWRSKSDLATWYLRRARIYLIGPGLFAGGTIVAGTVLAAAAKLATWAKIVGGFGLSTSAVGSTFVSPADALARAKAAWQYFKKFRAQAIDAQKEWMRVGKQVDAQQEQVNQLRQKLQQVTSPPVYQPSQPPTSEPGITLEELRRPKE